MKYLKILAIAILGLLTFTSCDNEDDASLKVGDTEISVDVDKEMNDFETRMANLGERIDQRIAEINAKMDEAGEEVKEELEEERAEWREMRGDLDARMKNFSANAKANWNEFKADTKKFFDDVEDEFES